MKRGICHVDGPIACKHVAAGGPDRHVAA